MSEPQRVPVSELRPVGNPGGKNQRTVKDTSLISVWVTAYAGVLIVFRVTKAVESLLSKSRKGHHTAETNRRSWNRAEAVRPGRIGSHPRRRMSAALGRDEPRWISGRINTGPVNFRRSVRRSDCALAISRRFF